MNGRSVDESSFLFPGDSPSTVRFDVVVPEGRLFVLGDHRGNSSDSRDHLGSPGGGMIPVAEVVGRADAVVWPFGHAGRLERPDAYARVPAADPSATGAAMGNRGRPRGVPESAAENLLPTGSRRAVVPSSGRTRAERRKLQRKVKRRRRRSAVKEIPLLIGVAVLIALVLKTFLVQAFVIPSGSMEQTIQIGDRVLVDKLTPWFGSRPQRGDVVVFKDPGGWLQGEQTTPQKDDPVGIKQIKEGLTFIGLLPSEDEKDLIKRVVGVGATASGAATPRAGSPSTASR